MNIRTATRQRLSGFIGNILEHYDSALYGFLAPFIAPLFFADQDPLMALIMAYGIMPLGCLTKPLGSLFFGWIGDTVGRKQALSLSLTGMAFVTVCIGFLPTYYEIGVMAPILLASLRMLQSFFAAGESTGGAIFILEQTETHKRSLWSSLYDASTIVGIFIASLLVTLLSYTNTLTEYWRFLFFGGSVTAIFGLLLRLSVQAAPHKSERRPQSIKMTVIDNWRPLIAIICCTGFSYTTYALPFIFMNGFVPLVTDISKAEMMQLNTTLLVGDCLLLPLFGYAATIIGKKKLMGAAAILSSLLAIPLFACIDHGSWTAVLVVRVTIVTLGVAFAAPYHAWALEKVSEQHRYTILSLGAALGSQIIGVPSAAISLMLYKMTGLTAAPGLYLLFTGLIAACAVVPESALFFKRGQGRGRPT